jgi:hypothetical protein
MRRHVAALALVLTVTGAPAQGAPERRFPEVTGSDLNGRSLSLPGDFSGPKSLVFIAFEMRQQEDIDSWLPFVQNLKKEDPRLGVFELPTIAQGYLFLRSIIENGMRSGIKDPAARASTITLFLDVKAFAGAFGLPTTRDIAALVVSPAGEILALVAGRYSEQGAAVLSQALASARK